MDILPRKTKDHIISFAGNGKNWGQNTDRRNKSRDPAVAKNALDGEGGRRGGVKGGNGGERGKERGKEGGAGGE